MKFVCGRCQTSLIISDGALPGKDLSGLLCALCQSPMVVEPGAIQQGGDPTPLQMITAHGKKMLIAIAEKALAERVVQAMSGLDWHIVRAETPASALRYLEDAPYDLVVLHERSDPPNQPQDPVLRYLQQLPMTLRRTFLLCLLCDEKPTLDYKAAFGAGVNLTVNVQNVEQLPGILSHIMKQYETSYGIFHDELRRRRTSLL